MFKPGNHIGLAPETREKFLIDLAINGEIRLQHLDGDVARRACLPCEVDCSHAPLPYEFFERTGSQRFSGKIADITCHCFLLVEVRCLLLSLFYSLYVAL